MLRFFALLLFFGFTFSLFAFFTLLLFFGFTFGLFAFFALLLFFGFTFVLFAFFALMLFFGFTFGLFAFFALLLFFGFTFGFFAFFALLLFFGFAFSLFAFFTLLLFFGLAFSLFTLLPLFFCFGKGDIRIILRWEFLPGFCLLRLRGFFRFCGGLLRSRLWFGFRGVGRTLRRCRFRLSRVLYGVGLIDILGFINLIKIYLAAWLLLDLQVALGPEFYLYGR